MEEQGKLMPKGPDDYIPVFGWLIGKKFAYLLAAGLIFLAVVIILLCSPLRIPDLNSRYRVFDYDSWVLKFFNGDAAVRTDSGYIAYIGQVKGGTANGEGTLYYENGSMLYEGEFSDGMYQGSGKLYDTAGSIIYEGNFSRNQIIYEELVGRKTGEVSGKYSGEQEIYSADQKMCVYMPGIEAVYYAENQEDALEEEWMTLGVYVLQQEFYAGEESISDKKKLEEYFGEPEYTGTTDAAFQDAVAVWIWKRLRGRADLPEMTMEEVLKGIYTVSEFQKKYELDISVFERDGFLYTFFGNKGEEEFFLYLIEQE